ncbi:MAG: hypothetical protein FJ267_08265, partial [Planctomycetes bacterium]|nr:hypothetical protein [Planctomycetota bacterium]
MARLVWLLSFLTGFFAVDVGNNVLAQPPSESDARIIREKLIRLTELIATLKSDMNDDRRLADVEVFAKGAEWILRHDEFYKPEYGTWTIESLDRGIARGLDLTKHQSPWIGRVGSTVFGYVSLVDRSLQPFAV